MKNVIFYLKVLIVILSISSDLSAQKIITVRFKETDEVLTNPGIGFTTFQRFNGDKTNEGVGWTEGMPIDYQKFDGNLVTPDQPCHLLPISGYTGDFLNQRWANITGRCLTRLSKRLMKGIRLLC